MKTSRRARHVVRIRITLTCLAIASLVLIELALGESLAGSFGQASIRATANPVPPSITISDVMSAAAR